MSEHDSHQDASWMTLVRWAASFFWKHEESWVVFCHYGDTQKFAGKKMQQQKLGIHNLNSTAIEKPLVGDSCFLWSSSTQNEIFCGSISCCLSSCAKSLQRPSHVSLPTLFHTPSRQWKDPWNLFWSQLCWILHVCFCGTMIWQMCKLWNAMANHFSDSQRNNSKH